MSDEKKEDLDTSFDSSSDENQDSSSGEDTDNNEEEEISVKKSEWEAKKKELASIKQALKQEREKKKTSDLSLKNKKVDEKEEEDGEGKDHSIPKWRVKEIETERISNEAYQKKKMIKRFPTLTADNDYGINEEVIENYNDLLQGRIRRGFFPRTKEDVSALLEKAVKMAFPELFVEEKKQFGEESGYEGLERGESKERNVSAPKLSEKDREFKEHIDNIVGEEKKDKK